MYETFEHTADLGLRVRADDLNTLFAEAGRGFCSILVDNPEQVRAEREIRIEIEGMEQEYLFFDWLNELLFLFETQQLLLMDFTVEIGPNGLTATARGEPVDHQRHQLAHEIKAITYHQLKVEQTADSWQAEVIVDI